MESAKPWASMCQLWPPDEAVLIYHSWLLSTLWGAVVILAWGTTGSDGAQGRMTSEMRTWLEPQLAWLWSQESSDLGARRPGFVIDHVATCRVLAQAVAEGNNSCLSDLVRSRSRRPCRFVARIAVTRSRMSTSSC